MQNAHVSRNKYQQVSPPIFHKQLTTQLNSAPPKNLKSQSLTPDQMQSMSVAQVIRAAMQTNQSKPSPSVNYERQVNNPTPHFMTMAY